MVPAVSGQESGTFPVRSESHTATVARWMVIGSLICTEGEAGKSSFLTICKEWGYFSEHKDGTVHRMDLCESCYDAWVRTFAIAPEVEQKTELI